MHFADYKEALAYLYSFTDYERGSKYTRDREENLGREGRLLALLDNPQEKYTTTHIAGSKGKGSTAAFIERVLRQAGVLTGIYTQPDLHTFRERMKVDGQLISEAEVVELLPRVAEAVEQVQASQEFGPFISYELGTALAFLFFAHRRVQHGVIEVGLGGRLDATNVIVPLVSVITSISYEHTQILGDTLTKIATEKAGIIKPQGIVVTSAQSPEALLAIGEKSRQREARLLRVGSAEGDPAQEEVRAGQLPALSYRYHLEQRNGEQQRFTVWTPEREYRGLEIPLAGQHQLENATAAVAALEVLRARGVSWREEDLRAGLLAVRWPGRMEVVRRDPVIVVDSAHNAESMQKLLLALRESFRFQRLIVALSLLRDKDHTGIVQALAGVDEVIITNVRNPRTTSIEDLARLFALHAPRVKVQTVGESEQAMDLALTLAGPNDLICATGSVYFSGEALRWAAAHGSTVAAEEIEGVDH